MGDEDAVSPLGTLHRTLQLCRSRGGTIHLLNLQNAVLRTVILILDLFLVDAESSQFNKRPRIVPVEVETSWLAASANDKCTEVGSLRYLEETDGLLV